MSLSQTVAGHRGDSSFGMAQATQPWVGQFIADESSSVLPWYVVHTKVRQEQTAFENLARQGFCVYLPRIKVMKRCRGRQEVGFCALFPRYIFVQPGTAIHSIAPVRSTLGVAAIVRFGQEPAVLRPETLKTIRDFEVRQNDSSDEDICPFRPGERVRVVDGPLTGLEGLISRASQHRVFVLMHLLGQDTRVSLTRDQLLLAN